MTIGYKFCEYAEQQGRGYKQPTKRLMQFLQRFNADWEKKYDRTNNNSAADAFRATMMVAALSHAFQKDLRADFKALNFPINDATFEELNPQSLWVSTNTLAFDAAATSPVSVTVTTTASDWKVASSQSWLTVDPSSGSKTQILTIKATANTLTTPRSATLTVSAAGLTEQIITIMQAGVPIIVTSVSDPMTKLSVYPNPTQDRILVEGLPGKSAVTLSDVLGKVLDQFTCNQVIIEIPTGHLASGVYFITVSTEQKKTVKRFIKAK